MKTLHILLITVFLLMTVHTLYVSGMLMTPESRIQLLTAKPTYVPGEKIQIIGAFNPNDLIHIDLVNPFDGTKNSTLLQSDNTGHFRTNYVVPHNAVNGTWKILATSGVNHASLDIQVISSNYGINESTTHVYGHGVSTIQTEPPLKQFNSGIVSNDVKCEQGLQLVIKAEDNSPACVKFSTATILIKHGWASSEFGISSDGARTYLIQRSTVSSEPCDTPYLQSNTSIAVLYMPTNSIGKVCVNYSNGNDLTTVTPRVFNAQNLSHYTQDISVSPLQANVVHGNSTIVYTITSGNKVGFYGLTIFCYGTPIAVGYDNQSRIITGDFPWLHQTFYCPLQSYNYHIVGVGGGMGIKYVPP